MEGKTNLAYYSHILVVGTLIDICMMLEVVFTPLFFHRPYQLLLEEEMAEFLKKKCVLLLSKTNPGAKKKAIILRLLCLLLEIEIVVRYAYF